MKKVIYLFIVVLYSINPLYGQVQFLQESFGLTDWSGDPAVYLDYTSDAIFSGDNPHSFQNAGSTGYDEASGGVAVLFGNWSGTPGNTEFIMQCNTEGYTSVRLSFGMKHNSSGWFICQLTNNYTMIEYSTDGVTWTTMDKSALVEGSSWPCADANKWGWVQLAEVLPTSASLYIRFTHTDPVTHPFYIDDITLTGFPPDNNPPSAPTNLTSDKMEFSSCVLNWDEAIDDVGIAYYEVIKDGELFLTTMETSAEIKYQVPGSSADFSVVAYDHAENASAESSILSVTFNTKPVDYKYSWEAEQASVMPGGDLEWKPKSFVFSPGSSIRYIDYEGGDDTNNGLTKLTPWKHHPWDNNATANAAACTGVHTYLFKRGTVYRGVLTAQESGTLSEPIKLTTDPSWGSGEAYFFGSQRFTSGWTQADAALAPNIPEPEKVWYRDVSLPETKMVVEMDGTNLKQLHVARSPNFQFTQGDILDTWWKWTGKKEEDGKLWMTDHINFTDNNPAYFEGATVFSQEDAIVMCTVWGQDVLEWDPDNNRVKVNYTRFGGVGSRYFIENTPFLLDTTSEFYYDAGEQRLFVRLDGDKDPNTTVIEAATLTELIKINSKSNIEISGITFGVTTNHGFRYDEIDASSAIRMTGICNYISIKNNKFEYVSGGVSLNNSGSTLLNSGAITISDNDFRYVGDLSITMATSTVYLEDIKILRNNIYYAGYRHQGRWSSSIPAIYGQMKYGEVAGNIVDVSFGNGIDVFWGKGDRSNAYIPFVRGMIYQNKTSNTLIGTNDYGGIESWQGGPAYCFNNYSHNAAGYKHYNNSSIGYAFYFDGAFKQIVFNNISSGLSHNYNSAGIMQVLGYYNMFVHNSGYKTETFLHAWLDDLALNGHNAYLSNVAEDVNYFFRHHIDPAYIPFDSYGFNVNSLTSFKGSLDNRDNVLNLGQFSAALDAYSSQLTQTGWNAPGRVFTNPENADFRPMLNGAALERGVKFFTAFPLAKVVGEWNFYHHPADSSIVMAENFYMTEEFIDRITYKDIPKSHLKVHNVVDTSFVTGALEDWTKGALTFDGKVYGEVQHAFASANKSNNVDMEQNDFIVEVYLRTERGHAGGVIVSKYDGGNGYELEVDAAGSVKMTLYEGGAVAAVRTGAVAVNDSLWHHILVEVNRRSGIDVYIDGELSNGTWSGTMPATEISMGNNADLLVGKDKDENYFYGMMDFLRISKGSLYDARTTVDELYKWQTDGPFLYDMRGNMPEGKRDAGAVETISLCDMTVSNANLNFSSGSSMQTISINAAGGFSITDTQGDFFTADIISGHSIKVTVKENLFTDERSGSLTVVGCGDSQEIIITQEEAACLLSCDTDTLELDGESQIVNVPVTNNSGITVISNMDYVTAGIIATEPEILTDTVTIQVTANNTGSERTAEVEIGGCDRIHTITLRQQFLTGREEFVGAGKLDIFPNPVSDNRIFITLPKGASTGDYTLSDISGKVVRNGQIHSNSEIINLHIEPGLYLLSITTGGSTFQGRVVVL